jgi:cytochrome c oxidase assembly factor CtaG
LAVTVVLYGLGLRRMGFPWSRRVEWARVAAFLAGLGALVVAVISPLDQHAEQQFSLHMVQHMVLIVVAAPLLVAARPGAALLLGLPTVVARGAGVAWRRAGVLHPLANWLAAPGVAWAAHGLALWVWHIPGPFEAALTVRWVHDLEHVSFFGTALWFWWSVAQLLRTHRAQVGVAFLSLFTMALQSGLLGVLITFSRWPWYPTYESLAPLVHVDALADQQLAGVIMWVPAGMVYFAAGLGVVYRWLRDDTPRGLGSRPG